jgi:predicted Zn-dependent protease
MEKSEMLSALLPSAWREYRERRKALREMREIEAAEFETTSLRDDNPLHRAKVSVEIGDLEAAQHFLAEAWARIPDYVLRSPDTIGIMLGLRQFDELDSFALKAAKRFPSKSHYLEGYAESAQRQHNWEEAVRRCAMVRKRFPRSRVGYVCAASCLRDLGRLDEAERLLNQAMRMRPNDELILIEHCRLADASSNWEESYRRWGSMRNRHPAGYIGAALALQNLGRRQEGEAVLVEGRSRFPVEADIAVAQAQIAEKAGDIAEALKRWEVVRQRFPFNHMGYRDAIRLLCEQQDWAKAEEIAQAAIDRFPDDMAWLVQYAQLAYEREDRTEEAKRWAAVRMAFPNWQEASLREAQALAAAGAGMA